MFGRRQHDDPGIAGLGSFSRPTADDVRGFAGGGFTASAVAREQERRERMAAGLGPQHSPLRAARKAAGWALMLSSIAVAWVLIFQVADFGTCSSGGPYVIERECAPGTGAKIGGVFGAVFASLVGLALASSWRAAAAAWGLCFTGGASVFFYFGITDSLLTWSFIPVGVLFALMGLPGLWEAVRPRSRRERRQVTLYGAYGTQLSVDAPQDGGPAPVVMAKSPVGPS